MVRIFAREGANVMIHGRKQDVPQRLAAENWGKCILHGRLAGRPRGAVTLIQETIEHFGRIDGLVNNAAR